MNGNAPTDARPFPLNDRPLSPLFCAVKRSSSVPLLS
uniref:Uncharacterized protein n=1 Tax=Arundo donax TaxID=35708 RepID=A0A0A8YPU6_ARUDO